MADINTALSSCRQATDQLIAAAETSGPRWTASPRPGKWSPSQIVEHVARSLEESANVAAGRPSKFPKIPRFAHPIVRAFLFRRVLKNSEFPNAKTSKAMNPSSGPVTPGDGRARLESAHARFDTACRELASRGEPIRTSIFGAVDIGDYVRFIELHTRHHRKQMGDGRSA